MKRHLARDIRFVLCFGLFLSFVTGYVVFSVFSVRFGFRPYEWEVLAAERFFGTVVTRCYTGSDDNRTTFMICAQKQLLTAVKRWGVGPLMKALEARQLAQGDTRDITQCHDLSHAIGAAGVRIQNNLNSVLSECTNTCVFGCQHGAVSAWYAMGKDIVNNLPDMCMSGIDWSKNPQGRGGCFHELGHAVASVAGFDVVKAVRYCDEVADIGRIDCAAGVFMELFEPATFATAPQPLPDNHPYWCGTLWSPYKEFCFHQAGVNVYGRTLNDRESFAACGKAPTEYQVGCFRSLGSNIFYVYQHEKDQANAIVSFCREPRSAWFMPCISGAILSSVLSHPNAEEGVRLCEALVGEERSECFGLLGATLEARRSQDEKNSVCQSLEDSRRRDCYEGKIDPYE